MPHDESPFEAGRLLLKFAQHKRVSTDLPFTFANGHRLDAIEHRCGCCGRRLVGRWVRGTVRRDAEGCAAIDAIGLCPRCAHLTQLTCRMTGQGAIENRYLVTVPHHRPIQRLRRLFWMPLNRARAAWRRWRDR
jgi:hypothetical protein